MDLETNRRWFHGIKQEADRQPGISFTLRVWNPPTGAVWGVGAPSANRAEADVRAQARAARPAVQRGLEDRAEAEQMLRLFRDENVDPGLDAAAYRPGLRGARSPAAQRRAVTDRALYLVNGSISSIHDAAARSSDDRTAITGALTGRDHELALWETRAAALSQGRQRHARHRSRVRDLRAPRELPRHGKNAVLVAPSQTRRP
jgi:hypothetical protein